jgi:hypothetical protein
LRIPRGSRWRAGTAVATVAVLIAGLGGCTAIRHAQPYLIGDGCQVTVYGQAVQLDTEQAAVAATIAGVGYRHRVPAAAVTVAYAAALQESKMHDVNYGDRDSVGIFQQRPSQGWGTRSQLEDPVYAATKFFAALVKVPGYLKMPIYQAAQAVQHSADGTAYGQYEQVATILSTAFTGNSGHAVWCWYTPYAADPAGLAAASDQLSRTFGQLGLGWTTLAPTSHGELTAIHTPGPGVRTGPVFTVPVRQARIGWAIAAWSIAHARTYGISHVRFAGYEWRPADGQHGWRPDSGATTNRVEIS